ncbi:hypothetical protein CROQUDRAFT_135358 [Cronartium quercuum f. sp. fusiforme G11]|uniref:Endopeptidase S2P n=1 Tax=Cronartium quercuum f. sp. fusiforme G11 TaxID=708437 RepID=A0A9P6T862_9BASI|nr:hypothetical protein CROQUDRAFT_135358 [Cronartium quercuum f. sp. fusiforme G11]
MSSIAFLLLSLATPWVLLYFLRLINPFSARSTTDRSDDPHPIEFEIGFGWICVHTKRLNRISYNLLSTIGAIESNQSRDPKKFDLEPTHQRSRTRSTLILIYDIGTIFILLLQIIGILILTFLFLQLIYQFIFVRPISQHPTTLPERLEGLVRRAIITSHHKKSSISLSPDQITRFSLKPLIPGITIPIDQLPIYLVALIISQTFHEFGHAFVAALNSVPMIESGLIISFPFFPIFYVSIIPLIPSITNAHSKLLALINLRIATAGWIIWNEGGNIGTRIMKVTNLWTDIGDFGINVISVTKTSNITSVLFPNDIITHLNHHSINHFKLTKSPIKFWEEFLSNHNSWSISNDLGWCVNQATFSELGLGCCQVEEDVGSVCFKSSNQRSGCLALPTVTKLIEEGKRCKTERECEDPSKLCVKPIEEKSDFIWFNVTSPSQSFRTVFFQGSSFEILRNVRVSQLIRNYKWIPNRLEPDFQNFCSYLVSLSIGIGFLNLLPIRRLDGILMMKSISHFHSIESVEKDFQHEYIISDEIDELNSNGFGHHIKPFEFNLQLKLLNYIQQSWLNWFLQKWKFMHLLIKFENYIMVFLIMVLINSFIEMFKSL